MTGDSSTTTAPPAGLSRRAAAGITAALVLAALVLAAWATDRPLWDRPQKDGRERRAAIVVRDDERPAVKWVTRAFAMPALTAAYVQVQWFTQGDGPRSVRSDVVRALNAALLEYDDVDLFLLAHTNRYVEWVKEVPATLRTRLRLVYNCGCDDWAQAGRWRELGARAYVGHVGTSLSEYFFPYFLRRWVRGMPLGEDVAVSNALAATAIRRVAVLGGFDGDDAVRESEARVDGDPTIGVVAPRESPP
jgi:hypothetical protein